MKISIITPVYNESRVRICLESVKQQTGGFDIERIVIDGNSTDETVEILQAYEPHIDCLIREEDEGMYDAINKGLTKATGDIIGILNADDRYQDEAVLANVAQVMANPAVDVCYGDLVYIDDDNEIVRYWESGQYSPYKFYMGWMPPHPTFFARKEMYDEHGMFDTSFQISADYELMLRFMLQNNVTAAYIDRVLVRMAIGGMSNASITNMLTAIKDMYIAWEKHESLGRYVAPLAHPLEKAPQFVRKPPS